MPHLLMPLDDDNYPFRITYNIMYHTRDTFMSYDYLTKDKHNSMICKANAYIKAEDTIYYAI